MSVPGTSLSTLAIRRHIGTLMVALGAIVLGSFVLGQLPVDLLPSITYPRIGLRADAPGISPEVAVDEVTRPLERALAATEGVTQVVSATREGRIRLDLYFPPGSNLDRALNDATATLNRARGDLPDTIGQPRLFKYDPSQLPVFELALTSDALPGVALRTFADEELARSLSTVAGVAGVDVSGGVREEIRVEIDPARLQRLGLGLTDAIAALDDRNLDVAGGRLPGDDAEPLTRVTGRFRDAEEIRNLLVDLPDANPPQQVYLRDFATVTDGTEEQRIFVNLNGRPAVKLSIQKQPEANTVAVADGVKRRLAELRQTGLFPEDLDLTVTLDESIFIRNAIRNVILAGVSGALLAAIAVLLFLGSLRQTAIVVVAIPLATLMALMLAGIFGLSLNTFSLGGLALGVGIVVDNAIVMLENIAKGVEDWRIRHVGLPGTGDRDGSSPKISPLATSPLATSRPETSRPETSRPETSHPETSRPETSHPETSRPEPSPGPLPGSPPGRLPPIPPDRAIAIATESSRELESALLASTSTNLVAVLPFLLVGGFLSLLFNELVLTISFAVAASLLVALTVVPALASRLLAVPYRSGLDRCWPIRQFDRRLQGLAQTYRRTLRAVLRRRLLAIAIAVAVLGGGSTVMARDLPQEILPRIDTGQARLWVQFPPGTTLAENQQVMAAVDEVVLAQPETDAVFSTSGGFLFGGNTSENALRGTSTIALQPGAAVAPYTDRLNAALRELNLVQTRLRASPESVRGISLNNSPVRADVDAILQDSDPERLKQAGDRVLEALRERAVLAEYLPDADPPQPEVQIRPDWERAADLDLSVRELGLAVQTLANGAVATQVQRGDRLVDVRVQAPDAAIADPAALAAVPLVADGGPPVRLGDVAAIGDGQAPGEIQRIDQRPVYIIEGRLADGATLGDALAELDGIFADLELPEGTTRFPSYSAQSNRETQRALWRLGGLATFLVFAVMAVQYNSLIDPLVILLTVPLALAGGIFGLFVTQTAIGAMVVVGAVLLVGIAVNNAIILVELANQIRDREGCDPATAMLQAAPQRLRPVLMTAVTTVLGMFPLALGLGEGSEFLQPIGIVVFSGLSVATLLTLFVIPCFYTLLHGATLPPSRPRRTRRAAEAEPQSNGEAPEPQRDRPASPEENPPPVPAGR